MAAPLVHLAEAEGQGVCLTNIQSLGQGTDRMCCSAMTREAKTVAEWDFVRFIPCHGVGPACILCQHQANVCILGRYRNEREGGVEVGLAGLFALNPLTIPARNSWRARPTVLAH